MKITIYELLGLVKDNKAPKKVLVNDSYYEYNRWGNDYTDVQMANNYWLFKDYTFGGNGNRLNDEVEIIEEEKDIEELGLKQIENGTGNYYLLNEYGTKCCLTKHSKIIADKVNELIKAINKLKNKE